MRFRKHAVKLPSGWPSELLSGLPVVLPGEALGEAPIDYVYVLTAERASRWLPARILHVWEIRVLRFEESLSLK